MASTHKEYADLAELALRDGDGALAAFYIGEMERVYNEGIPTIIWNAAQGFLHGVDDASEQNLRDLADALGVDHEDVEALS